MNTLEREKNLNIVSFDNYKIQENQIAYAMLDYIDKIRRKIIK